MIRQIFFNEVRASFNLRKPNSDKPTNIYLVCRIDKKQVKLSTGVRVYPNQWNIKKQEAYVSPRLTELDNVNNSIVNEKISELKSGFLEFKSYICDNPDEINNSLYLLRKYVYKEKFMKQQELQKPVQWLRRAISQDKTIKSDGKRNTLAIYWGHLKVFEEFLEATGRDNITFADINLALIKDYETYLFNRKVSKDKSTKTSTVGNKITALISIIKRAEPYGLIDTSAAKLNQYKKPKSREGDDNEIYLTKEEIDRMYALKLEGLEEKARDVFVLQCWTGQRFSDIQLLNDGIVKDSNNGKILEIVQKKRTHKISIPLLPVTLEILEKYNFQVPKIRENTMLKYIKEAGQKAGITDKHIVTEDRGSKITNTTYYKYELIGTHTGRRSFISNMLKCGYDGHILMKITGHKTEASFKKYAKLSSEDAANVILDGEARKEESKEKQTNQPVTKSKIDVLDYLFAESSLLRLDELQNKGIDIYDLIELKEAVNIIKDTKRTDKPKKFLAGFDKSTLFTRVDKLDGIIWDIARRCFDFTLYQVFQQKVIELGLSERIKEVMDRDEIDGFWYQEYSLGKLEEENGF